MRPTTYETHKGPVITQLRVLGCCLGYSSRSWYVSSTTTDHWWLDTRRSRLLGKHGGAAPRRTGVRRGSGVVAGVGEYKTIHWLVGGNARDTLPG